MRHIVTYEPYTCAKCNKKNMGAAGSILDLLVCPDCQDKYRNELMPHIESLVRDYFKYKPERLENENICKEHGHLWTHEAPIIKICNRCRVFCNE